MEKKDQFMIQPCTTRELARHYGVTPKVLRKWLASLQPELGIRIGNYYSEEQVKIIVERLGKPAG